MFSARTLSEKTFFSYFIFSKNSLFVPFSIKKVIGNVNLNVIIASVADAIHSVASAYTSLKVS